MKISKILLSVAVAFSLGNATEIEVQLDPRLEAEIDYSSIIDIVKKDEAPACVESVNDTSILEDSYWTSMLVAEAIKHNSEKCLKAISQHNKNFKNIKISDPYSSSYKELSVYEFIKKKNPKLAEILK